MEPAPPPELPADLPRLEPAWRKVPKEAQWSCKELYCDDDGATIAEAIQMGTAVAVSDGSLKDNAAGQAFGTAAFVIEGIDSQNRIEGWNIVPGPLKTGDSYRCELAGLIGIVFYLNALCAHRQTTTGSGRIACDNINTIRIFTPDFLPKPSESDFDLVNTLWRGIQEYPIEWKAEHVKGHKDKI